MPTSRAALIGGAASALILTGALLQQSPTPIGDITQAQAATGLGRAPADRPAAQPPNKQLQVEGVSVPTLAPGGPVAHLEVEVRNPSRSTGSVTVQSVDPTFLGATTAPEDDPANAAPTGCTVGVVGSFTDPSAYDVLITPYRDEPGSSITLGRNDSQTVPLEIQMFNRDVNQDVCKGLFLHFSFLATATSR